MTVFRCCRPHCPSQTESGSSDPEPERCTLTRPATCQTVELDSEIFSGIYFQNIFWNNFQLNLNNMSCGELCSAQLTEMMNDPLLVITEKYYGDNKFVNLEKHSRLHINIAYNL